MLSYAEISPPVLPVLPVLPGFRGLSSSSSVKPSPKAKRLELGRTLDANWMPQKSEITIEITIEIIYNH